MKFWILKEDIPHSNETYDTFWHSIDKAIDYLRKTNPGVPIMINIFKHGAYDTIKSTDTHDTPYNLYEVRFSDAVV